MNLLLLAAALLLDLLLGDPPNPWHPVHWLGRLADFMEHIWRKIAGEGFFAGLAAWISVVILALTACFLLLQIARIWAPLFWLFCILIIWISFALRGLEEHALRVLSALEDHNLDEARSRLAFMVSRDTRNMDREQVIISTLESLSENFSDSLGAPLFYGILLGPMGIWGYRVINTLDAMWGYRNEQYKRFGTIAARADDLINFIPARISALVLILAAIFIPGLSCHGAWNTVRKDGQKHKSPNSGYPEAAAAGALGVGFGGPVSYFGKIVENPSIGKGSPEVGHIRKLIQLNRVAALLILLLPTLIYILYITMTGV